jgi:hypothetical protein
MAKRLKAEELLTAIENVVPGKSISWPVYDGKNIKDAKTVQDYVVVFFKTGMLMPIPVFDVGLDIQSVQTEYDDDKHTYLVVIEGIVTNFKKEKENE